MWFLRNLKMLRTVYRYNYGMKMTKKNFCGFFSCIFLMQVGGSQSYPCVCIADILYKGIYGKMCTRIIRCIWMIFPLMSSKYIQAVNQSCWSEVWSTKLASKTQCAFDCGSTTIILIFSVLIIKKKHTTGLPGSFSFSSTAWPNSLISSSGVLAHGQKMDQMK